MNAPKIYNIFPLLAGKTDQWIKWAEHAARLGFDWVYLNPVQQPGFSGSLYSIKDYYRINPSFLHSHDGTGYAEVELAFREMAQRGVKVIVDLVINHTAIDSPLTTSNPEFYKRDEEGNLEHPWAIDPADARNKTVWGDLYEIDNEESSEREALWSYWEEFVAHLVRLGVNGFRCDAAYKVPAPLWGRLIERANRESQVLFFAETLGCRLEEIEDLREAGFNYLYNSSKYWNFDAPWALEQHALFQQVAPSISFPESHDTERLYVSSGGREQVMKQRYAFAAAFSAGLQITMGMEFGWEKPCHVVTSRVEDQEAPKVNLTPFITRVNRIKAATPLLNKEGRLTAITSLSEPTLILKKEDGDGADGDMGALYIIVNKEWDAPRHVKLPFPMELTRVFHDDAPWSFTTDTLDLSPAEVVYGRTKRE